MSHMYKLSHYFLLSDFPTLVSADDCDDGGADQARLMHPKGFQTLLVIVNKVKCFKKFVLIIFYLKQS